MRYEDMVTEGAVGELRRLMGALGIDEASVRLLDVAKQLGEVTHRAEPNEKQQQQTGLMPGHLTHLTTDPGAHDVFATSSRAPPSRSGAIPCQGRAHRARLRQWLTSALPAAPDAAARRRCALRKGRRGALAAAAERPLPGGERGAPNTPPFGTERLALGPRAAAALAAATLTLGGRQTSSSTRCAGAWLMRDESAGPAQTCPLRSLAQLVGLLGIWGRLNDEGGVEGLRMAPRSREGKPVRPGRWRTTTTRRSRAWTCRGSRLLVGVPRAGRRRCTTVTANDPNVVPAAIKEINYFNPVAWGSRPLQWYLSQFKRRGAASSAATLVPR